ISYTPVNDAPVLDSASLTLSEGQTVTLSDANFGVSDPDNSSFTYTVSSVSGGYFQLSSAVGTPITSFTSADLTGGLVQFVDDGNEVAPSFDVTANDGSADSNTLSATISYTPVNDA
ncbi:cadherin-like domain-containing protein, partial [Cognatazoarcus halotolerans]|uniref:cadherin-like domain-containing protein n=1 Tax=Cognatazoarcus halotolerans TaxID=2686016 RepID=UPI00190F9DBE